MNAIDPRPDGVQLTVWVVPGANRTEVRGVHAGAVRVRVAAPAEAGKANDAVVALLSSLLAAPVRLVRGRSSRRKILFAEGVSASEARRRLGV